MSKAFMEGLQSVLSGTARVTPRYDQPLTLPAVRFQRIYTTRVKAVDGLKVGVTEVGLQLDCMATTYSAALDLADSVRGVLDAYNGAWGTLTAHYVVLDTENDFYEEDGDRIVHWVTQRYKVYTDMD